jgi:hypothetical protein
MSSRVSPKQPIDHSCHGFAESDDRIALMSSDFDAALTNWFEEI